MRRLMLLLSLVVLEVSAVPTRVITGNTATLIVQCGEDTKSEGLPVLLQTMDGEIGQALGWRREGPLNYPVYSNVYIIQVSVASLNYIPHNGSGDGRNSGYGTAFILRDVAEGGGTQRNVGGIRFVKGGEDDVNYSYRYDYEVHLSTQACNWHYEE